VWSARPTAAREKTCRTLTAAHKRSGLSSRKPAYRRDAVRSLVDPTNGVATHRTWVLSEWGRADLSKRGKVRLMPRQRTIQSSRRLSNRSTMRCWLTLL